MTGERRTSGIGDLNFRDAPARQQAQRALLRFIVAMSGAHVSEWIAFTALSHIFANNVDARARANWFDRRDY
jgi:hypothetical protein